MSTPGVYSDAVFSVLTGGPVAGAALVATNALTAQAPLVLLKLLLLYVDDITYSCEVAGFRALSNPS